MLSAPGVGKDLLPVGNPPNSALLGVSDIQRPIRRNGNAAGTEIGLPATAIIHATGEAVDELLGRARLAGLVHRHKADAEAQIVGSIGTARAMERHESAAAIFGRKLRAGI